MRCRNARIFEGARQFVYMPTAKMCESSDLIFTVHCSISRAGLWNDKLIDGVREGIEELIYRTDSQTDCLYVGRSSGFASFKDILLSSYRSQLGIYFDLKGCEGLRCDRVLPVIIAVARFPL